MPHLAESPAPSRVHVLAGRAREVDQVLGLVRDLRGRGGALLVTGEPGIGKTSLLALVQHEAEANGCVVVDVAGVAAERHLPFAGLQRVVHLLAANLPALPEPQRRALLLATGDPACGGAAPGLFVLGLALLELVGRAGRTRPVVILVDDAQWLDPPTVEVLGFVARRLPAEAAAVVLASREQAIPDPLRDLTNLRLGPLDVDDARRVATDAAPDLSDAQILHVLKVAAGNPLALRELGRLAATGTSADASDESPLTERLERAFGADSAALPTATRVLLLAMAFADGGDHADAVAVAARLAGPLDPDETLAPARAAGLVTSPRHDFAHPLMRSALVRSATPDDRQRTHAAWADHLAVPDPDRSAWHRAAAGGAPDEGVAQRLEEAAVHAERRGAPETAARWLQRAADMSTGPGRCERLLRVAELSYRLGRYEQAQAALTTLRSTPLTEEQSDWLLWLEGAFDDDAQGGVDQVPGLLAGARRAVGRGEPALALQLLDAASRRRWWSGRTAPELAAAADEVVVSTVGSNDAIGADDPRVLVVHAHADTLQRSREVLDALTRWAQRPARQPEQAAMLTTAAFNLADFPHALHFARSAVDGLRERGQVAGLAQMQVLTAWSALFLGRWELAYTASDEAYRLASETRQPVWAAHARLAQADHQGRLGHTPRALELVADAERLALSTGRASTLSGVEFVRGTIELGRGRPADAYAHLRRGFDPTDRAYHPLERLWLLDYLSEAAARTEAARQVQPVVDEIRRTVADVPSPGYQQALRLSLVHLADDDQIDDRVAEAYAGPDRTSPWFGARVDLAHGLSLRRRRRIADARHALHRAQTAFDDIGARSWSDRTRAELAATGEPVTAAPEQAWRDLSPQELQIARLASDGLTNREIGSRLYLSHRTVGSHLYRLFPKLGITSRRQLAHVLQDESG